MCINGSKLSGGHLAGKFYCPLTKKEPKISYLIYSTKWYIQNITEQLRKNSISGLKYIQVELNME